VALPLYYYRNRLVEWFRRRSTEELIRQIVQQFARDHDAPDLFQPAGGQSTIPTDSTVARGPNELPRPIGTLHSGGVVSVSRLYRLQKRRPSSRQNWPTGQNFKPMPTYPEGRYYLDPKCGIPVQESKNPEPARN
jgi:hypothetical protein